MPKKTPQVDGFGPRERKRVHSAIRQVWYQSTSRRLAVKRATDPDGFFKCERCKKKVPKIHVDHKVPVGALDSGNAIMRLFCPSSGLQCWCHGCHREKTKAERAASAKAHKRDFSDRY